MEVAFFLFVTLLLGCSREQPAPLPIARPPSSPPALPPAYEALPRLFELTYPLGDTLYTLLLIQRQGAAAWLPCVVDSAVLLAAGPADRVFIPRMRLPRLTDLCLGRPREEQPVLSVEPIDGGRSHVLLAYTWSGGNATESFGLLLWRFPSLEPLLELTGLCRAVRLLPESILVVVSYSDFVPDDVSAELPHALWVPVLSSFWIVDPALPAERLLEPWQQFLEEERQQALRTYDSVRRRFHTGQWEGELVAAAVTYIVSSRLAGKAEYASAFLQRELPRLRRLNLDPALLDYLRAAARMSLKVEPRHVFLHAASKEPKAQFNASGVHPRSCSRATRSYLPSARLLPSGSPSDGPARQAAPDLVHRQRNRDLSPGVCRNL